MVQELAGPGTLNGGSELFSFSFPAARLPHETYDGINARVRYLIRFTISRSSYVGALTKELEFAVRNVEEVRAMVRSVSCGVCGRTERGKCTGRMPAHPSTHDAGPHQRLHGQAGGGH